MVGASGCRAVTLLLRPYIRRFLTGYSSLVAPLTSFTGNEVAWEWMPACQRAFDFVKSLLVNAPMLRLPDFDCPFTVVIDASDYGIRRVMLQGSHLLRVAS